MADPAAASASSGPVSDAFRQDVLKWEEICDALKAASKDLSVLRKSKKELETRITSYMQDNRLNRVTGRLELVERMSASPLNHDVLLAAMQEYQPLNAAALDGGIDIEELCAFVLDNRPKKKKIALKPLKRKAPSD